MCRKRDHPFAGLRIHQAPSSNDSVRAENSVLEGSKTPMKVFNSVGHFFATIGHGISSAAKAVAKEAPVVEAVAQKIEPVVEAVTAATLGPAAAAIERLAFQLLGNGVAVVAEGQGVADAKGLNIQLDEQLIADLRALAPQFTALAGAFGISKPTSLPIIAPKAA